MSFGEAVSTCLTKYADFTGRARRSEYWWFLLFVVVVEVLLLFINPLLNLVAAVGLFLPGLAAAVRRLHDTGRSGGYYFIILIPLVGVLLLIVWVASEGNIGPNQYGDPV